jgi:7-cyano-7-deazaguanine synthase
MTAIVLLSGGMDSTTLAYRVHREYDEDIHALSFDYGQRHRKELEYADITAEKLDARHDVVDLSDLGRLLGGSALTDTVDVPEGHYSDDTMRATVVPNRNAIMLNVAIGVAVARKADAVYCAVHAGDHPIYPDCRPEFIDKLNDLQVVATDGFRLSDLTVEAPFVFRTKAEIVEIGDMLGVPWLDTWSCYQGGDIHCGRCGTCVERAEAFAIAEVADPTPYEDPAFWTEQVAQT